MRIRERHGWMLAGSACALALIVPVACSSLELARDGLYGPNACNGLEGPGNAHIEAALVERLPAGTLRSYMTIGADCDDRTTGSVAAAWSKGVRPATVVDLLTSEGWSRVDPSGGSPAWYARRAVAADPQGSCVVDGDADVAEYAQRDCNLPVRTQMVLTKERDSRVFAARLKPPA